MATVCPPNCIKGTPLWSLYDVTDSNPEFCLYESIVGEYTDIAGFPVMYYRAKSKLDRLYGEDANQDYHDPVETKLYYEPTDEPNIIDGFGIRSDETLEYTLIPKANFTRDVGGTVSGVPVTLTNAFAGTGGYVSANKVPTTGGTGTGLYVDIIADANGLITKIELDSSFNHGYDYVVGDVITITGGNGDATVEIGTIKDQEIGPMAGDVIKTLWNNRNYEIVDVGAEQSIFQGRKLVWEFILRPFRFSEQSTKSEEVHRSVVDYEIITIYPDGEFADITYPDGTEAIGVPVDTLDIDMDVLECGSTYKKNPDGSYEIYNPVIVTDPDIGDEGDYLDTGLPLKDKEADHLGDNDWVEVESDQIDDYGDVDTKFFGY